ncbi:MAG: potassium transporter Kup [Janthinobacterium lividum]
MSAKDSKPVALLAFGALGVVFGDIGTSPLYAVRQVFHDSPGFAHDPGAILGVLSLVLWSIVLVVCVKYVGFVMRADHDGEGGTLAMLGLIHARVDPSQDGTRDEIAPDANGKPRPAPRERPDGLTLLALFASALLFGDGMVTPAISVLSAVEGLKTATPVFQPVVLPLSVVILVALFAVQSGGTERVAKLFGPVMLAWFATIGAVGLVATLHHLSVLAAANPAYGLRFLVGHGWTGFATLGAVVLAFSGVEALFADLGHYGRRPITLAWYCVVLPGLVLNYLGQGGHILDDPGAAAEPFFSLVPHWAVYPMVALSTLAAIIASQALISGAFSLTQQAVNMGYAPRYAIKHTSADTEGQVYMPVVNGVLAIGCIAIVLGFRTSDALGAAYGLAVIGTMTITSVVYFVVLRRVWGWGLLRAGALVGAFLVVEVAFLVANLAKLLSGAWLPIAIALVVFGVVAVWTDGRARYRRSIAQWEMPVARFRALMGDWTAREQETAVFLTGDLDQVPLVGQHPWLLAHVRSKRVMLLKVETSDAPFVAGERLTIESLGDGLFRGTARFGFMESPDVGRVLEGAVPFEWDGAVFYLGQPIAAEHGRWLDRLRCRLFLFLGRTGLTPIEFFRIPPAQAVSVALEVKL